MKEDNCNSTKEEDDDRMKEDELIKNILEGVRSLAVKHKEEDVDEEGDQKGPAKKKLKLSGLLGKAPSSDPTKITNAPPLAMTGVDPALTRICAKISGLMYGADPKADIKLETEVEVLKFEDHGELAATTPPFIWAVKEKTLIMGWRGSQTIMDWMTDFHAAPVTSARWKTNQIRVHAGFLAMVESDFVLFEKDLVAQIVARGITEVIFTGHSLGGAMAQVAHLIVEGQLLTEEKSAWDSLKKVTFRTISFSAPMSVVILKGVDDPDAKTLLSNVSKNVCNIIFGNDPVPRIFSMVEFLLDLANDVGGRSKVPMSFVKKFVFPAQLRKLLEDGVDLQSQSGSAALLRILFLYRHLGKIVYYDNAGAHPLELTDTGPLNPGLNADGDYRYLLDVPHKKPRKATVMTVGETHNFLVCGPGLAY
jgi:hypothetical protein